MLALGNKIKNKSLNSSTFPGFFKYNVESHSIVGDCDDLQLWQRVGKGWLMK